MAMAMLGSPYARDGYIALQLDDDDGKFGALLQVDSPPSDLPATISDHVGSVKVEDDVYQRCGLERSFKATTRQAVLVAHLVLPFTYYANCRAYSCCGYVAVSVDLLARAHRGQHKHDHIMLQNHL